MRVGMRRIRGAAMVAACAMTVTLGAGTSALAATEGGGVTSTTAFTSATGALVLPALPDGWTLDRNGTLTWPSPVRIPAGDARLVVAAGDRTLGVGILAR